MNDYVQPLPGLARLMTVLARHNLASSLNPPSEKAPKEGLLFGAPVDPLLSSLYAQADGGEIGDLLLYSFDDKSNWNLIRDNSYLRDRQHDTPSLAHQVLYFGTEVGMAYRFAVVPSLAQPNGVQPVVYLDEFESIHVYPLASSIDRMFDLWARFCEARLTKHGRLDEWMIGVVDIHILNEVRLVSEDEILIRMMKEGRFDSLIGEDAEGHNWVKRVTQA